MSYEIVRTRPDKAAYRFRGGNLALIYSHEREVIDSGPAETGKTVAACVKAHLLASKYPGCQGAIIRKTYKSMPGSVCQTFERVTKGAPIFKLGDHHPERYIYANGSQIWLGGMDNPDKVLSSERDFVYVNQAEELCVDDWEKLVTRTTGRGSVIPHTQVFGDCNPGGSRHWIRERAKAGQITLLTTSHKDNPSLFGDDGEITEQGKKSMAALDALTGVRRQRLFEGKWATPEGLVYDIFDASIHVRERKPEEFSRWTLAVDVGYTNPAVILLIGIDGDGRFHIAREFYKTGIVPESLVALTKEWADESQIEYAAVDAAAAGVIASMLNSGIPARPAKGKVQEGIQRITDRLAVQGDGLPRLTIDPACISTINEFESYVRKPGSEEPVKENDHALDALRYADSLIESAPNIWVL